MHSSTINTAEIGKSMPSVWPHSTPARKEKVWTKAIFIYFTWELFALNKYKNSWIRGKAINIADYAGYLGEVFLFCGYKKTITYGISLVWNINQQSRPCLLLLLLSSASSLPLYLVI